MKHCKQHFVSLIHYKCKPPLGYCCKGFWIPPPQRVNNKNYHDNNVLNLYSPFHYSKPLSEFSRLDMLLPKYVTPSIMYRWWPTVLNFLLFKSYLITLWRPNWPIGEGGGDSRMMARLSCLIGNLSKACTTHWLHWAAPSVRGSLTHQEHVSSLQKKVEMLTKHLYYYDNNKCRFQRGLQTFVGGWNAVWKNVYPY